MHVYPARSPQVLLCQQLVRDGVGFPGPTLSGQAPGMTHSTGHRQRIDFQHLVVDGCSLLFSAQAVQRIRQPAHGIDIVGIRCQGLARMYDSGFIILFVNRQHCPTRVGLREIWLEFMGAVQVLHGRMPFHRGVSAIEDHGYAQLRVCGSEICVKAQRAFEVRDRCRHISAATLVDQIAPAQISVVSRAGSSLDGRGQHRLASSRRQLHL